MYLDLMEEEHQIVLKCGSKEKLWCFIIMGKVGVFTMLACVAGQRFFVRSYITALPI